MQRRLLTGAFGIAELRASVSYMPGEKVGFGSSGGAAVCALAAESTPSMMRNEMSRGLANTGRVSRPDWPLKAQSRFARGRFNATALRRGCAHRAGRPLGVNGQPRRRPGAR